MKIAPLPRINTILKEALKRFLLSDEKHYRKILQSLLHKQPSHIICAWNTNREVLSKQELTLSRPLTSQNTWEKLCEFYMSLPKQPRILEYGSGISTFYHLENLKQRLGGELTSVEHGLSWYCNLKNSLQIAYASEFDNYCESVKIDVDTQSKRIDWSFSIPLSWSSSGNKLTFRYLYFQNQGRTGCGTLEEFRDYVTAPSGKFDVIIIDGRARKACIRYVLENQLLSEDGLLVLFEAGRGHPSWPMKNQMSGTYDYQPEVSTLLSMGAELIDGSGREKWENWVPNRPKHRYLSEYFPMEACFWYKGRTTKE